MCSILRVYSMVTLSCGAQTLISFLQCSNRSRDTKKWRNGWCNDDTKIYYDDDTAMILPVVTWLKLLSCVHVLHAIGLLHVSSMSSSFSPSGVAKESALSHIHNNRHSTLLSLRICSKCSLWHNLGRMSDMLVNPFTGGYVYISLSWSCQLYIMIKPVHYSYYSTLTSATLPFKLQ